MLLTITRNGKVGFRLPCIIFKTANQIPLSDNNFSSYSSDTKLDSCQPHISFFDKFKATTFKEVEKDTLISLVNDARNPCNKDSNLIVLDDIFAIKSAVKMHLSILTLFFTKRDILRQVPFSEQSSDVEIYNTRSKYLKALSYQMGPTDIMGIFARPIENSAKQVPLTVILDNITEPNNVCNIIKCAAAYNVKRVLLTKGCVDMYNGKIVADTNAALLHIAIYHQMSWESIRECLGADCPVLYADTGDDLEDFATKVPYYERGLIDFGRVKGYGLVIGGETSGVSRDARALSAMTEGQRVVIPIVPKINSLNSAVAAAILMSEFQRVFAERK